MNLDNIKHSNFPFNHWQFSECLDENALKFATILLNTSLS